jgi:UDP-glucuronate decarboxylase
MGQAAFDRDPESYLLVGCLTAQDRIVVTGASGWLGRSLLHELEAALGERIHDQVLALGSTDREIRLGSGRPVRIHAWEHDLVADWRPTSVVHLAYLTRDHAADTNLAGYLESNLRLTALATRLMHLPGIRSFLAASSGAAVGIDWAQAISPAFAYGTLKRLDEDFFIAEGTRVGVPTVIARTWSVSGPYCTKPAMFAFSDFILQALGTGVIEVRATGDVWRRYVDAGQYLALCLREAILARPGVIESTGPQVELRDLAQRIADTLGGRISSAGREPGQEPRRYVSLTTDVEDRIQDAGAHLLGLQEQIRFTAGGLRTAWGST